MRSACTLRIERKQESFCLLPNVDHDDLVHNSDFEAHFFYLCKTSSFWQRITFTCLELITEVAATQKLFGWEGVVCWDGMQRLGDQLDPVAS